MTRWLAASQPVQRHPPIHLAQGELDTFFFFLYLCLSQSHSY